MYANKVKSLCGLSSNFIKTYLFLILILLLALFLRSYDLSNNPPELFSDELINFVSARSIVETGKDLHGNLKPYFSDNTELRPPVYGYTSYFSSLLLGENAIGIRAPSVIFGLLSILALYLLTLEIFRDRRAALSSAFFLAIVPWHIHYSRVGWEPGSFLPFLLFSSYFFVYGVNRNKKYLVVLSFCLFTSTIYTYQTAPLYSFLFLSSLFLLHWKYFLREKKLLLSCVSISLILVSPYLWTVFNEPMLYTRARHISTFKDGLNAGALSTFAYNYISHFNPRFLFISGDPNLRHGAGVGTIYWIMLPLILAGLVFIVTSNIPKRYKIFIAFWIAIFPLGGSLTNDGVPHATRTLPGAPLLCLLSGLGFSVIYQFLKDKSHKVAFSYSFVVIVVLVSLLHLGFFSRNYYFEYPKKSEMVWGYGQKKIFAIINKIQGDYDRACLDNLNYTNELQLADYYLESTPLEIISGVNDFKCRKQGSIIVQWAGNRNKRRHMRLIDTVTNLEGEIIYNVYIVD